jgi:hypothetical protein
LLQKWHGEVSQDGIRLEKMGATPAMHNWNAQKMYYAHMGSILKDKSLSSNEIIKEPIENFVIACHR